MSKCISHRYLTKMCDQVVSLISPEHAQTILWSEEDREDEDEDGDDMRDASARMFKFEVAQTNEKEESVTVRKGFKVNPSLVVLCTGGLADKFGNGITILGCFPGDCSSRSPYRRSGSDETCADRTVFTIW